MMTPVSTLNIFEAAVSVFAAPIIIYLRDSLMTLVCAIFADVTSSACCAKLVRIPGNLAEKSPPVACTAALHSHVCCPLPVCNLVETLSTPCSHAFGFVVFCTCRTCCNQMLILLFANNLCNPHTIAPLRLPAVKQGFHRILMVNLTLSLIEGIACVKCH